MGVAPENLLAWIGILAIPVLLWLAAEFRFKKKARIVLGLVAIAAGSLGMGIAYELGLFEYNLRYSDAAEGLIKATVAQIEAGNAEGAVEELKRLDEAFNATYEEFGDFDVLARESVQRLSTLGTAEKQEDPSE